MIVVKLMGGLGNQMFQYAFAKNLAVKNRTFLKVDLTFLLDRTPRENFVFRDYDLDIFNLKVEESTSDEVNKFFMQPKSLLEKVIYKIQFQSKVLIREKKFYFESNNFSSAKNCYLDGYWQSEKYFKENEEIIRKDFSFKFSFSEKEQELNKEILLKNAVCINFRRTDFVNQEKSAETHGATELEYYEKAIDLLITKVSNPHFYIFSDDIQWCMENIKISYPITFVGHEFKGTKFSSYLQLMKNCKHFIIPNSTFAWWAAWLCEDKNKIVITPKKWFKDISLQEQTEDIIPEKWIKL